MRADLLRGVVLPVVTLKHPFQLADAWEVAVSDWLGAGAQGRAQHHPAASAKLLPPSRPSRWSWRVRRVAQSHGC